MRYATGDIWEAAAKENKSTENSHYPFVVVTTNTVIKANREAVMGGGIALQAAEKYPELPSVLASHILKNGERLLVYDKVICFPTKTDWREKSKIRLIQNGCKELIYLRDIFLEFNYYQSIFLPKLGCGLGGLNWEREVRPILDSLLDDQFCLVSND